LNVVAVLEDLNNAEKAFLNEINNTTQHKPSIPNALRSPTEGLPKKQDSVGKPGQKSGSLSKKT